MDLNVEAICKQLGEKKTTILDWLMLSLWLAKYAFYLQSNELLTSVEIIHSY